MFLSGRGRLLVAAVGAAGLCGCEADYGRGVLLTLIAPEGADGPATLLDLYAYGDGDEVRHDFAPKGNGPALFNGAGSRESILYKPMTATTEISLTVRVFWGEREAVPEGALSKTFQLGASTVRDEWRLVMAGPDADLAASPSVDMDMAPGKDGAPQEDGPPQQDGPKPDDGSIGDMDECPKPGGGTCKCIWHSNGYDGGTWPDCYAENSGEAALEACRLYNSGTSCSAIPVCASMCSYYPNSDLEKRRYWCGGKTEVLKGGCSPTGEVWK
jgi:hypothetical protein